MRLTAALLWIWIVAAFAAYLYQFRPILGAIARTVGLA